MLILSFYMLLERFKIKWDIRNINITLQMFEISTIRCYYGHFLHNSLFAVVQISWWVGRLGAFPHLTGFDFTQTKCQAKQNLPVHCSQVTGHRRRRERLFSSGLYHVVLNRPAESAFLHNRGNHLGPISSKANQAKWHLWKQFEPMYRKQCAASRHAEKTCCP